jgi:hypothetical protein
MSIDFSHEELSLMVFALQGPQESGPSGSTPDCEEACPVASHFEELFDGNSIPRDKQLVNHLNNHLREALLECGMLELMGAVEHGPPQQLTAEKQVKLQQMNSRLSKWSCTVNVDSAEQRILYQAVARLPFGAWVSMPRTLWRLRKKLKHRGGSEEPVAE